MFGLIPVVLVICSTLVSEERRIDGAGQELTRAEQKKCRAQSHPAAPLFSESLCVMSRVKEKEDVGLRAIFIPCR